MALRKIHLEQSKTEHITSNAGLSLIGQAIRISQLEAIVPKKSQPHGVVDRDILKSYIGLASLGKNDFEAIENYRGDDYFLSALNIEKVPSCSTLRQRMDANADLYRGVIDTAMIQFLQQANVPITPLHTGHVALDLDVFPMDNSRTKKEGVSRTYKGHDGYAPLAVYLGEEGWSLGCELREGKQHGQKEFIYTLERILPRARLLTSSALLMRLDSGHDALENRLYLDHEDVDYLIKWNPRQEKKKGTEWLKTAHDMGHWVRWKKPRKGKRVATFTVYEDREINGVFFMFRRVMQVTERTIDKKGQMLLFPDIEVEGWWTSLELADDEVIKLYQMHATSEQFHSEFKTDLDVERLPSGKFDTNDLVLACHAFAYNALRFMGLKGLIGSHSPIRHQAKRRRIKTVLQELMYLAARVITKSRQCWLRFGKHCAGYDAFGLIYRHLASL